MGAIRPALRVGNGSTVEVQQPFQAAASVNILRHLHNVISRHSEGTSIEQFGF